MPPLDAAKAEERALTLQEREMHRYYQPWLDAHGSAHKMARHINDLGEAGTNITTDELASIGYRARQSRDRTLTAFSQLAALRLGVRRAMVSLLDSTHQYVLSEATKTISLVDDDRHAEFDDLWLGSTVLAKSDAVCECALRRQYTVKDGRGNPYTAKAAVIPDLRQDADYQDKPYVWADPGIRFYAGVPIKARSGHIIGVYGVSDENTRHGLTYDELRFMQDMAVSIMDHLEWARDRVDRYKGERIVRGMADFIEVSPSMRRIREERAVDELANTDPEAQALADTDNNKDNKARTPAQSPRISPHGSHITNIKESPVQEPPQTQSPNSGKSPNFTRKEKGDSLTRMLDRAARILRESTLAEGVVFFGPNGNGTNAKSNLRAGISAKDRMFDRDGTGTDEEKRTYSNEITEGDPSTDSDANSQLKLSKILGISLSNRRDASLFHNTALAVPTLENYFKLYPHGKSFHFTEAGSGLSSEDDSASESQKEKRSGDENEQDGVDQATKNVLDRKQKIKMSHTELLKNLPGVRNVIFLPLWDYIEDKMVAGAFLWTSTTGRMMTLDDDLSYLRAFGNTIMGEVARMTVLKDDRAKTTFIASMSHELRSPLHGILGSVEFLQDTATDPYQMSLINSISTCGKTLLETLDHVLDHSKINKIGRSRMRKNARSKRIAKASTDSPMDSFNVTADIDLSKVVEEVAEAVCAGHAFKMTHTGDLSSSPVSSAAGNRTPPTSTVPFAPADGKLSVLLDISPRASWNVRTQPGALRRIVMNLLGNALKYTSSGFVKVSLRACENANQNKINVVFSVVDSGKGMSQEFQNTRLFVPFSQEDTFQPGTGLGLSIVRQIVDSLGGNIELKSAQGVGTEIDVYLSLTVAETSPSVDPADEEITSVAQKTRGLRVCLLDSSKDKGLTRSSQSAKLDATLEKVCRGWFQMEVLKASSINGVDADVFMYTEPPSVEYLLEHHSIRNSQGAADTGKEIPLIIVCLNTSEAIAVTANHSRQLSGLGRIVEVITQPCGPRKMAYVLSQCIRRAEEKSNQVVHGVDFWSTTALGNRVIPVAGDEKLYIASPCSPSDASHELSRVVSDISLGTKIQASSEVPNMEPNKTCQHTQMSVEQMMAQKQRQISAVSTSVLEAEKTSYSDVPHVLLVDDNRINLQLLVMFMRKHKFTYVEAQNGQEALDAYISSHAANKRFDFVLMDISMPVMNGNEATKCIRAFEQENGLNKATIIALTGLASAAAQQEAESSGIDIYMPKPVNFRELRPLLERKDSAMG